VDGYFNSPASKQALQFYADLFNKYQVSPSVSMENPLASLKSAMYLNGPWMVSTWRDNFPDFYNGHWGAMPLPHGTKGASPSGSWNLAITKQSKNKELAWQVLSAITGVEGSTIYCGKTGNLPARKSVLDKTDMTQPPLDVVKEQLVANAKARPVTPKYPLISEAYMDAYNAVAFGENVDTAFNNAVKKMNDALK
jgi:fructooligosaccharide transport system substrate-binding protein